MTTQTATDRMISIDTIYREVQTMSPRHTITATHMAEWIERDDYATPTCQQRIVLWYDPASNEVGVSTQYATNDTRRDTWLRRRLEWTMPSDTHAVQFVAALPELDPLFDRIHAGYDTRWDGSNHVGTYTDDARMAIQQVADWLDTECPRIPGENAGVWHAADWYTDYPEGVTANTTDAELAEISEREDSIYYHEYGAVIVDTLDYLTAYRDQLREETDHA
jgi:hypothetical protein